MKLIADVQYEDINLCMANGSELTDETLLSDLRDCTTSGDVEDAYQYVLDTYEIEWRTVRCVNREPFEFKNYQATPEEITQAVQSIYPDSDTDFTDQNDAKLYLIWQAANNLYGDL